MLVQLHFGKAFNLLHECDFIICMTKCVLCVARNKTISITFLMFSWNCCSVACLMPRCFFLFLNLIEGKHVVLNNLLFTKKSCGKFELWLAEHMTFLCYITFPMPSLMLVILRTEFKASRSKISLSRCIREWICVVPSFHKREVPVLFKSDENRS